jgi:uncharacterized membrane protein YeaQ/YmgE (transglycosylase-associated protein family)
MLMALFLWLLVGGVVGWFSTRLAREDAQRHVFLSVCTGMTGAFVGSLAWGLFVSSDVSTSSLIASLVGAIIALTAVKLSRRESK